MLIIFDCDGVLIDSELICARVEAEDANALGHPITAQEILENYVGRPSRLLWEAIENDLGAPLTPDFMERHKTRLAQIFANELEQIEGVANVLNHLREGKRHSICVASSTEKSKLITNLKTTALFQYFGENVFSASEVARPKPHPDVFLFAANKMGFAPEECLVIEDSLAGIRAAKAANIKSIGFLGASHIQTGHGSELTANGAVQVFTNMLALPAIIARVSGAMLRNDANF
ncbi:MAG: putative haloacid dehalogenase-like hydrolase [Hyphomonadaceae bacterium]|nr:MAG: putative haloacid dehalogenase-like hydrolase [Hyphomonadaceae bacterium]KAF0187233.1 MAG: putative haloacid dehalogenase-like hydrolase [Hyphomonadaceae bacterium]